MEGADIIKLKKLVQFLFSTFNLMYVNSKTNPSFLDQNFQSILQTLMLVNFNPHNFFDKLILNFHF
jgi:hypothetical protein